MLRLKDSIKTFLQEGRGSDWFSLIAVRHTTKNPLTYTTLVSICPNNRKGRCHEIDTTFENNYDFPFIF